MISYFFRVFAILRKNLKETKWIKARIFSLIGREKSFEMPFFAKTQVAAILDVQIVKMTLGKLSFCRKEKEKPLSYEPYPSSFPACYIRSRVASQDIYFLQKSIKIKTVCVLIRVEEKIIRNVLYRIL